MDCVNVAIVDDSAEERQIIKAALDRYANEKKVLFKTNSYESAEEFLYKDKSAEILFLDIEFPVGINGMQAAEQFRSFNEETILIFITNIRKFVIKGYEVGALNYILKPVNYYSFAMTLDRAMRQLKGKQSEFVRIKTADGFKTVDCRNIYCVEIMKHDVEFYTTDGVVTNYGTLNMWEEKLTPFHFVRCSSSALVNLRHVEGVSGDEVTVGGRRIKISRAKKKMFMKVLTDYYGDTI